MDATPEAFERAVRAHLAFGTTTLVPTAMSATRAELADFIRAYKAFKKTNKYADLAHGLHLEGPYFAGGNGKSRGAQKADVIRPIDLFETAELLALAEGEILRWDAAPELEKSAEFAHLVTEAGAIAAVGHSRATAEETAKGFDAGFSHVTHFYNACTMYEKRDQVVTAGTVEATYLDPRATVELIADGKHIPRYCLLLALKIKGEDGVLGITDATRLAGTDASRGFLGSLTAGTEVIVEDGVAKLPDRTSFAGSICTMARALRVLCVDYGIPPVTAAKMLSTGPARHIGRTDIGKIAVGMRADLVLADESFAVKRVMKDGKQA
jgi:N-acetylglucosamine-6-phosphate deacetylase